MRVRNHAAHGLILTLAISCTTVRDQIGIPGGQVVSATITEADYSQIKLWRWTPTRLNARRVFVVPELGFDHRLVAPLCARIRDAGFDVATLDWRDVTGVNDRANGLSAWIADLAVAASAFQPDAIVAIGYGGWAGIFSAASTRAKGVVAINVPFRWAAGNDATRLALANDGYDPRAWIAHGLGPLLLGRGHETPASDSERLAQLTVPLSHLIGEDIVSGGGPFALPEKLPVRALVSMKDNLVPSENALPNGGRGFAHTRRLARLEGFRADYGHLDWLVDREALDDVTPAIVDEIEALR